MSRALLLLLLPLLGLPLLGAPADGEKNSAAAVQAPALPPAPPPSPAPAAAAPVAPPLPGQLEAAPAAPIAPPSTPLPGPPSAGAPALAPRPALAPANRIPEMPRPALTPAPSVPLNQTGNKPVSSTSSSGQFIVHGDDLKLRSAFSGQCEDIAASLRQLLKDKDPWQLPIVVLLKTGDAARAPGPPAATTISQISHGGFHLQVTVNVRGDLRPADLRAELIRVLLAERILRHQKELATTRERLLPDWIFTGILEAMDYRKRARPSALFGAIFTSGKIYGIEEIIEASASAIEDGLSKTIYQTSCCALVLALLDQPEGGLRMGKFLNSLASDKRPERELLNQWYPGFAATPASLNKWWSLQMASLATPSVSEPLSAAETAKQLEQALILRFKASASEVPRPRPVVVKTQATPDAATSSVAAAGAAATKEEPSAASDEEKRSFLQRINPFGKKERSDEDVIADAAAESELKVAEAPRAESTPAEPADTAAPKERRTMFSRFLGGSDKDKEADKEAEAPAVTTADAPPETAAKATAAPKAEEPKKAAAAKAPEPKKMAETSVPAAAPKGAETETEPAPAESQKTDRKGSILNPLKWFRGNKKDEPKGEPEAAPPEAAAKKDGQASLHSKAADLLWVWSPLAGDVWAMAEDEQPAESRKTEGFLGLKFGRKKDKEKTQAAEPEAPKLEESKPSTTGKAAPKTGGNADAKPPEKAEPKAAAPTPAATADEAAKEPPAPIKIRPLFGRGKKDAAEADAAPEVAEPVPMPTPAPAKTADTAPSKPAPKPTRPASSTSGALVDAELPIEDYNAVMKRKDRAEILTRNLNALGALQTRAAVLFRPIIVEYSEVVADLMQGKTKGADQRLQSLRERSAKALAQSKAVRDYLDVYEANESPVFSGLFDDYLTLPETIKAELPARADPLSNYLDALDREFSKE